MWALHGSEDGLACTSCCTTIVSKSAHAWIISSKSLFGFFTQPRNRGHLRRHLWTHATAESASCAPRRFSSQLQFPSPGMWDARGQVEHHHIMWVRLITYLLKSLPRIGLKRKSRYTLFFFFFCVWVLQSEEMPAELFSEYHLNNWAGWFTCARFAAPTCLLYIYFVFSMFVRHEYTCATF